MRNRVIVFTALFILTAYGSSGASAQVPVTPPVARFPALQDSVIGRSLREAREVIANAQRLFEDTTTFAAANRALESATALSAQVRDRLVAQQAALERTLQLTDAQLRTVFEQLEQVQRRLDEMMREQPN